MQIRCFTPLPNDALRVRLTVFVDEQGFVDEVDEIDNIADHVVLYDGNEAIGTCRVFPSETAHTYILGRLCVLKPHRGKKMGSLLVRAAEDRVAERGGTCLTLHAQCRAQAFYEQLGYAPYGAVEDEQGCPHIWMKKEISR